jgi:hypothetical protein
MAFANPYRPGVGLQPPYLAGRDQLIRQFRHLLIGAPVIPANARVTGLRGVGKTVLLKTFQNEAEDLGWATISTEIEPRHSEDKAFFNLLLRLTSDHQKRMSTAMKIRDVAADVVDAIRKAVTVKYEGFEWSLGGDLDAATRNAAELLLDATKAQ